MLRGARAALVRRVQRASRSTWAAAGADSPAAAAPPPAAEQPPLEQQQKQQQQPKPLVLEPLTAEQLECNAAIVERLRGQLILAPLTRGNHLPFRRLCADFGAEVLFRCGAGLSPDRGAACGMQHVLCSVIDRQPLSGAKRCPFHQESCRPPFPQRDGICSAAAQGRSQGAGHVAAGRQRKDVRCGRGAVGLVTWLGLGVQIAGPAREQLHLQVQSARSACLLCVPNDCMCSPHAARLSAQPQACSLPPTRSARGWARQRRRQRRALTLST